MLAPLSLHQFHITDSGVYGNKRFTLLLECRNVNTLLPCNFISALFGSYGP